MTCEKRLIFRVFATKSTFYDFHAILSPPKFRIFLTLQIPERKVRNLHKYPLILYKNNVDSPNEFGREKGII